MMREFSKISPAIWGSERFINLASDDARYLYFYFLTCEHQTSAGVFRLRDAYAIADLRWSLERYHAARMHLVEAGLVKFDAATSFVLITRWFKHNPPMNGFHFIGVMRVIQKIDCEGFRLEAEQALQEAYDAKGAEKVGLLPKHPETAPSAIPSSPVTAISPALRANLTRKRWDAG